MMTKYIRHGEQGLPPYNRAISFKLMMVNQQIEYHMKKIKFLSLFFILTSCIQLQGQTLDVMEREYGYDAAGNRILRKVVVIPEQKSITSYQEKGNELDTNIREENYYLDDLEGISLKIFPNPTHSRVRIEIQNVETKVDGTLSLYNVSGALLFTQRIQTLEAELDLSGYSKGTYFAVLRINGKITNWKVVKK